MELSKFTFLLICVDDSIMNIGVRRLAAYVREKGIRVKVIYMPPVNIRSFSYKLSPFQGEEYNSRAVEQLSEFISDSNLIGFSLVSYYFNRFVSLKDKLSEVLENKLSVIGGAQATIAPEDTIKYADIICRGEGEQPLHELIQCLTGRKGYHHIRNLWINDGENVIKNPNRVLMNDDVLNRLPVPDYGYDDNFILDGDDIVPLTSRHYMAHCGATYSTIFTHGCPNACSFCANNALHAIDKGYRKIRKPSVDHLMEELISLKRHHPEVKKIQFLDDSFLSLNMKILEEFSTKYIEKVNIPFVVGGVSPLNLTEEKFSVLIRAGMIEVRMGIQSGDVDTLKIFQRKTPTDKIIKASKILALFKGKIIPPAFDIIVDNPFEGRKNVGNTILLLSRLSAPFTLNIFSLQYFPRTVLTQKAIENGFYQAEDDCRNRDYKASPPNIVISLFGLFKVPEKFAEYLVGSKWFNSTKEYSILLSVLIKLRFLKRAYFHILFKDFSILPGRLAHIGYRIFK